MLALRVCPFLITSGSLPLQPAYHSSLNEGGYNEACGCAVLPLKTEFRGPAEIAEEGACAHGIMSLLFFFFWHVISTIADKLYSLSDYLHTTTIR